ncbi:hypothetical protein CRUP_036602, partial [Coryphaenoides rupestris]
MCLLTNAPRFLRCRSAGRFMSSAEVKIYKMSLQTLPAILEEWKCVEEQYQDIQDTYKTYLQKLDEISKLQSTCSSSISTQRRRLKEMSQSVKRCSKGLTEQEAKSKEDMNGKIKSRQNLLLEMEAFLPRENGFAYKDEYETFKLYLTVILLIWSFVCSFFISYRFVDAILYFLLVWYYCTLTIRESILITNGSRPDGILYQGFRNQFLAYSLYQSFVQCLQYYYQSGCLYRLRALGERHNMDLTMEGFQSWMWRGLTFLLPFLFLGHFWQLFNSVSLFRVAWLPDCKEWQALVCGLCFLVLFTGNFFTTVAVVRHKVRSKNE